MEINFLALLVAAVSTLVVGFIWYNPKVFGTVWMKEADMTEDKMKGANMALIFGLALFFAFLLAVQMQFIVIHQWGAFSAMGGDPSVALPSYEAFMNDYGNDFRTFKHGALHGSMAAIFFALPIIATNALFERRSWKYILVNTGFWLVCMTIMGAIICGWK